MTLSLIVFESWYPIKIVGQKFFQRVQQRTEVPLNEVHIGSEVEMNEMEWCVANDLRCFLLLFSHCRFFFVRIYKIFIDANEAQKYLYALSRKSKKKAKKK